MSDSKFDQLTELFPDVSEEFLMGIYSGNQTDSIEEIIDVILSFEFRPSRAQNSDDNPNGNLSSNASANEEVLSLEVAREENKRVYQQLNEEVIQQSVPMVSGLLPSKGIESSVENCMKENRSGALLCSVNEVSEIPDTAQQKNYELNNNCFNHNTQVQVDLTPEINSPPCVLDNNLISRTPKDERVSLIVKCEQCIEEGDSCSPECSVKYVLDEILSAINYNSSKIKEAPSQSVELACSENVYTLHNDSTLCGTANFDKLLSANGAIPKQSTPRKNICSNPSQQGSAKRAALKSSKVKNEEERLRRKLINQNRFLREKQAKSRNSIVGHSQFEDLNKRYSLLCNIFTDANPAYLLEQCKLLTNEENILNFISQNIEMKNYPKKETVEVKEEPKLVEEFQCTVAQFLEAIPDPAAEFSSANYIRAGYEKNAEIYMKARYEGMRDEEQRELLKGCGYNLTMLCSQLESEGFVPRPGVLDFTPLHHPADVFFHQEVWYIEHRREIQQYLDSAIEAAKMQEQEEPPRPPPPDEAFECQICAEEIVEYADLGTCDGPNGHLFCINCIKRSAEIRFGEGETTFPCLVNCGAYIPLPTIEELLPMHVFAKLMGRIQEEEIRKANIAGVETCPFCPFAYGPGEETLFLCLNPDCMKPSCRICRKEDHSPELCEMFKNEDEEKARLLIENRMAEALMRTCYSCGKKFIKSTGCNKMQCQCGARMCYICRKPVLDYSHFNGDGGSEFDKCPLFSNDDDVHARPVQTTAQQVFNEIAANNPQLRLDAAKLIPK